MVSRAQRLAAERQSNKVLFDASPEEEKKAERFATLGRKATAILEYLKEVFSCLKQQQQQQQQQLRPLSSLGEANDQKHQQQQQPQPQPQQLNIRAVTSKGSLLDTIDFKEDRNDPVRSIQTIAIGVNFNLIKTHLFSSPFSTVERLQQRRPGALLGQSAD